MVTLKLTFVNVGYGEAMLLECPDPSCPGGVFTMLIDGGGAEPGEFTDRSTGRIPLHDYLRERQIGRIDLVVNTHPHEDHVSGLPPVAASHEIGELWQIVAPDFCRERMNRLDVALARNLSQDKFLHALNDCAALSRAAEDAGTAVRTVCAGMRFELCRDLRCSVLAPTAEQLTDLETRLEALYAESDEERFLQKLNAIDAMLNNRSIILLLEYKGVRLLLPGDTNLAGFGAIDRAELKADLFKVGHHGQRDGADRALLEAVRPSAVVCCASSDRRYHSAEEQLMQLIADCGAARYFSDCPPVAGESIPPHSALIFTIGGDGAIRAEYR